MLHEIRKQDLQALFLRIAEVMEEHAEELGMMDAKLGDGDLGLTMTKGFSALPQHFQETKGDFGKQIFSAGMKFSSVAPSTMGFLMGTALMTAGKRIMPAESLDASNYSLFLKGLCEGVIRRGKASPGERTILDALTSAERAASELSQKPEEPTLPELAQAAAEGAARGVEATKNMLPKYGKAAVHRDAAMGLPDQGAYAAWLFLEAMADYIERADPIGNE